MKIKHWRTRWAASLAVMDLANSGTGGSAAEPRSCSVKATNRRKKR